MKLTTACNAVPTLPKLFSNRAPVVVNHSLIELPVKVLVTSSKLLIIDKVPRVIADFMLSIVPFQVFPAFFASPAIALKLPAPLVKASCMASINSSADSSPLLNESLISCVDLPVC